MASQLFRGLGTNAVYLFGSTARGDSHKDSDLDLLVTVSTTRDGTPVPKRARGPTPGANQKYCGHARGGMEGPFGGEGVSWCYRRKRGNSAQWPVKKMIWLRPGLRKLKTILRLPNESL